MKIQLNLAIGIVIAFSNTLSNVVTYAQPSHAKGPYKRWNVDPSSGRADIELFDNGPTIQCSFQPANGNANPKHCQDGRTTVTTVEADCPPGGLFANPNKECFAASIIDGDAGKTYMVNSAGDVIETDSADFPDEEHAPEEENERYLQEVEERRKRERSLLRGGGGIVDTATVQKVAAEKLERTQDPSRSLQTKPVIDILVIYTQGAKTSAGGSIVDIINLAVANTNIAYSNSGIEAVLNLVHLHEDTSGYTADQGSSSMSPSLRHLTNQAGSSSDPDGLLDYVQTGPNGGMRAQYGADMVALITTGAGCGIAWLSGHGGSDPSVNSQYSVTKYSCAAGNLSFAHELGHNMGAHHDKGTTNACGSTNYRYGFRDPAGQYRSVLSYSCNTSQCDSNPGGPCTRSMFFSSPNPTGWANGPSGGIAGSVVGVTDNARRINEVAAVIAGFYPSVVVNPTGQPTTAPPVTPVPTKAPNTPVPTNAPDTPVPTAPPTREPTRSPQPPTTPPTPGPTDSPTTREPTVNPTDVPTPPPTTGKPTALPTPSPTVTCADYNQNRNECEGVGCTFTQTQGNKVCS